MRQGTSRGTRVVVAALLAALAMCAVAQWAEQRRLEEYVLRMDRRFLRLYNVVHNLPPDNATLGDVIWDGHHRDKPKAP